jgi:hypothetical protein
MRQRMTFPLSHKTTERDAAEDRSAAAVYIASMSSELAGLARRHGLDALGYLLDMARLEADSVTGRRNNVRHMS